MIWLVVTGTWLDYDFPFSWECHHPNWRTPSFFRGVGQPPTSYGKWEMDTGSKNEANQTLGRPVEVPGHLKSPKSRRRKWWKYHPHCHFPWRMGLFKLSYTKVECDQNIYVESWRLRKSSTSVRWAEPQFRGSCGVSISDLSGPMGWVSFFGAKSQRMGTMLDVQWSQDGV